MKKDITFKLNGDLVTVNVESDEILLDVLRDKLGVKSPKHGCGRGECGACSVFLNGEAVRSCIIFAIEVDGQEIETLEGLQKNGLTDLQKSFVEHNAFQCGFCASGITIQTTELLKKNPRPTIDEIKEALAGNLCRCTGYTSILEAITDYVNKKGGQNE